MTDWHSSIKNIIRNFDGCIMNFLLLSSLVSHLVTSHHPSQQLVEYTHYPREIINTRFNEAKINVGVDLIKCLQLMVSDWSENLKMNNLDWSWLDTPLATHLLIVSYSLLIYSSNISLSWYKTKQFQLKSEHNMKSIIWVSFCIAILSQPVTLKCLFICSGSHI